MKLNVGGIDRIARIVVGALLIVLTLMYSFGILGWIVGTMLLATGVLKTCPAYSVFGINTCTTPPQN